jgi:hypothetical protein
MLGYVPDKHIFWNLAFTDWLPSTESPITIPRFVAVGRR